MNDFKLIKNKFDKNEKDYMKKYKKYDIQKGGSGNSIQIKDNYYLRIRDKNETKLVDYLYDKNVYNPELPFLKGSITEKSNEEKRRGKVLLISEIPFYIEVNGKPNKELIKITRITNILKLESLESEDLKKSIIFKQLEQICNAELLIKNYIQDLSDKYKYFNYDNTHIIYNNDNLKYIKSPNETPPYSDEISIFFEDFYTILIDKLNYSDITLQYQDNLRDLYLYKFKYDRIYNIYNYYLNNNINNLNNLNLQNIKNYLKSSNLKKNTQINRIYFFALDDLYIDTLITLITAEHIEFDILNSFILELAYKEKRIFILISLSIIKEINLSEDSFSLPSKYENLKSQSIEYIKEYFLNEITAAEKKRKLTTFYEYYDKINILFSQENEDANQAGQESEISEVHRELLQKTIARKAAANEAAAKKVSANEAAAKKVAANEAAAKKVAAAEKAAAAKKVEEERAAAEKAAAKKAAAEKAAADKAAENAAAAKKTEEERVAAEKAAENQAALSDSRMNYFMSLLNVDDLYNDIPVIYKKWEFLNSEEKKIICEINELKTKQVWNENVENNFQSLKEKYCTNSYSKSEYNKIIKKLLILGITPNIYCSTFHYTIKDNFFLKGNQLSNFIQSIIDDSKGNLNLKYCRLENSHIFYEDFSNLPIQSIKLPITIYFYNQDDHDPLNKE